MQLTSILLPQRKTRIHLSNMRLKQYETAIKNHLNDKSTSENGTYGFVKDSRVFFNPNTNNAVAIDKSGEFITGFKVIPGTPQYDNYMKNGVLR